MTEATLTSALTKTIRGYLVGSVVFKHADRFTAGVPDLSVTWMHRTAWVEVKLISAIGILSTGIQRHTLMTLAKTSQFVWYVLYVAYPKTTVIVRPEGLDSWRIMDSARFEGHDHRKVAEFLEKQIVDWDN